MEADFFFFFFREIGGYFGFVESIEPMGGDRIAIHLDSVSRADVALDGRAADDLEPSLGFLRIVTTHNRLRTFAGLDRNLEPGDWLELEVGQTVKGPPVWGLQLRDGRYLGLDGDRKPTRTHLSELRRLGEPEGRPPRSLGAAAASPASKGKKLRKRYDLSTWSCVGSAAKARQSLNTAYRALLSTANPTALDVGQASCNHLVTKPEKGSLYFDAGEPIWLHVLTAPMTLAPTPATTVVLSHWDSDHYALGRHHHAFAGAKWIAPAQTVGPNAYNFAKTLRDANRLQLVDGSSATWSGSGFELLRCTGTNLNGGGIALCLHTSRGTVLLTGDADYDQIPTPAGTRFTAIQMPHHGGRLPNACPIPPCQGATGVAIASFGAKNRYGHPNATTLKRHKASWLLRATADWQGAVRGDKTYF